MLVPELQLTVDTQIIMIANGMSNLAASPAHLHLRSHFDADAHLALDADGQVRAEYERKMGAESEGRKWLTFLAVHDRIRMFDLATLPRKAKVELDKAHFHQTDRKFVRLAMATDGKWLVAEESDYSTAVRKVLKKHGGVLVHTAESACVLIVEQLTKDPPD